MSRLATLLCLITLLLIPIGCKQTSKKGTGGTLATVEITVTASTQYLSGTRTLRVPKGDTTAINIYEAVVSGKDASGNAVDLTTGSYTFLWNLTGNSNLTIDTDPNYDGNDRQVRVKCLGDREDNGGTVPQATLTVTVTPPGGTAITNASGQNVTVQGIRSMEKPSGDWTFTQNGSNAGLKVSTQNGTVGDFAWGSGFTNVSNTVINNTTVSWTANGVDYTGTMAANGLSMSGTHTGGGAGTWSATR